MAFAADSATAAWNLAAIEKKRILFGGPDHCRGERGAMNAPAPPSLDPALFEAARAGDDAAWCALHRQWAPVVLGWCCALGGEKLDPEDLAREVFVRLWRLLDRLEDPGRFRAFLYSITRRVISEQRRRAWVRRRLPGAPPERADPRPDPERSASSAETARAVGAILDGMRSGHREVLILCEIQGYTAVEAADLLGISPNTVKSRLARARARFDRAARGRGLLPPERRHA